MSKVQYITNDELVTNAKACYEAERLTAQLPANEASCEYYIPKGPGKDCYCAIGASLKPNTLRALNEEGENGEPLSALGRNNQFMSFEDFSFAVQLQELHDEWCYRVRNRFTKIEIKSAKIKFLKMLAEHRNKAITV